MNDLFLTRLLEAVGALESGDRSSIELSQIAQHVDVDEATARAGICLLLDQRLLLGESPVHAGTALGNVSVNGLSATGKAAIGQWKAPTLGHAVVYLLETYAEFAPRASDRERVRAMLSARSTDLRDQDQARRLAERFVVLVEHYLE